MNLETAVFYTDNINKITEFYRDIFGFNLEYQDGDKYVSFIFSNGAKLGIKKKDKERELPGAQTVIISMESGIENWYELLQQKNVQIYKELTIQKWGKNFSVLDPDKNKVEFVERLV
ncbi:MAG: glyoxalase superfamily protein [Candidatus Paceibacterota bacterium]|jgi:predicted enzyme related to lactoylglutathione lyase